MDTAIATGIATVLAAAIAAGVGYATQRSSAKAAVHNQTTASRTEIEKEAFERAKSFYSGALDRAEAEIKRQDTEIVELRSEVTGLRSEVHDLRGEIEKHLTAIASRDAEVRRLAAALAARADDEI